MCTSCFNGEYSFQSENVFLGHFRSIAQTRGHEIEVPIGKIEHLYKNRGDREGGGGGGSRGSVLVCVQGLFF